MELPGNMREKIGKKPKFKSRLCLQQRAALIKTTNMEPKFKKGDVVCLKSGGPKMTVHHYKESLDILAPFQNRKQEPDKQTQIVYCQWFEKDKLKGNDFHEDLLDLIN